MSVISILDSNIIKRLEHLYCNFATKNMFLYVLRKSILHNA